LRTPAQYPGRRPWLKLTRATGKQDPLRNRPAVHLGRAVIDAERAHLAKQPRDDRVIGDAEPTQDLHAAVDHAPDRLRADDFRHARFVAGALALIEQPSRVPDSQAAGVEVHLVVGEHETDPLMLAERLAEGGAATRIIGRNVVCATSGAEPPHAMG